MSVNLSEEQLSEFPEAFSLFDREGDGFISTKHIGLLLRTLGQNPTENQIQEIINELGKVKFNDFLKLMTRQKETDNELDVFELFKLFDKDGDGFISSEELRQAMISLGDFLTNEECDELIRENSTAGDGKLSYEDFLKLFK